MEIPTTLIERFKTPTKDLRTERGEIMKELMENINISRIGTTYKPLTMPRMGVLLEKIPTESLYALLSKCKEAGELANNKRKFATEEQKKSMSTYASAYSKAFYWNIRPQKPCLP